MATKIVVTDENAVKAVETYSKRLEIEPGEGAARMIGIAVSRLNALKKYANKDAKPAKKAPAKKAVAK